MDLSAMVFLLVLACLALLFVGVVVFFIEEPLDNREKREAAVAELMERDRTRRQLRAVTDRRRKWRA
jgi:hypothetical protein